jgi:DNA-binding transcriptional LysR family regulator
MVQQIGLEPAEVAARIADSDAAAGRGPWHLEAWQGFKADPDAGAILQDHPAAALVCEAWDTVWNRTDLSAIRRFCHEAYGREGWLGCVHLGTTLTGLMYNLPPILRRLRADHPGIELLVSNMPTPRQHRRRAAELDRPGAGDAPRGGGAAWDHAAPHRDAGRHPAHRHAGRPRRDHAGYLARQPLVLEHARGAVYALVMQWLSGNLPLQSASMHIGTIEAAKKLVASELGMSIVPDVATAEPTPDIVVRPLNPPLPCTLALIEHRNKPDDPALDILHDALLALRDD